MIGLHRDWQTRCPLPFMAHVAYDKGMVKNYGTFRKLPGIGKVAGMDFENIQRSNPPFRRVQAHAIQPPGLRSDGVTQTAAFKISGGVGQGIKARSGGQSIGGSTLQFYPHLPVERLHLKTDSPTVVLNLELRGFVCPREDSPTGKLIKPGIRVTAGNKHALANPVELIHPFHRNPMRRVLAVKTDKSGKTGRANLFQSEQADPDHGVTAMKFGPKGRRYHTYDNPVMARSRGAPRDAYK